MTASKGQTTTISPPSSLFDGGGQMGELMRSINWARTPVGPVESWPQSLKTALSVLLKQRTAVFIFWGPEHVQFYNDAYRPILGSKKHPAAMGQRGAECWPEIWDIIHPMLEAVHRGESTSVEDGLLVIDRDGYLEEGYYTYTYSPIAEETGAVGGVFCIVYDTTARVIGERRLRTLRDLATRTITKDPVAACRAAAATLSANPHDVPFAALYLYEDDRKSTRLVCACGCELDSPVCPPQIVFDNGELSFLAQAANHGSVTEIPDLAKRIGPLPSSPWPVPVESGIVLPLAVPGEALPTGFMIAGVSPRKRLDASYRTFFELAAGQIATAVAEAQAYDRERRRAESLAELDRAKTTFFSNVSHEFRTPLTLMLGPLTDILARPQISIEECREELAVAHRNCLRLVKLVNTLLDFSRIEAGRIQARYEPTDLATLTANLASLFRSAIERANLRLVVDCPPLAEPVYVDREMWEKIVLNLLSNAFKFTFKGEIAVSLRQQGRNVELAVRDTGVGIPDSQIEHVFERFHRIEGTRGRTLEGSGIGLALVQELARLHGGAVRVESVYGKGTTFTVSIPLGSAHLPQDRIGAPHTQQSTALGAQPFVEEALRWLPDAGTPVSSIELLSPHQQLGRETIVTGPRPGGKPRARILVADDNADMRDYLGRLLGEHFNVHTFADGASALEAIREDPPDLLLADVMMPGMNGFELLHAVRSSPAIATLPVILVSARAGEESSVEGLRAGADDYLVKPFSARELLVRVSSRLEIARLRSEAAQTENRLRAEAETERRRLRDLIQHAPAVIALLEGPDHVFRLANHEYLKVTNRSEADLVGRPIKEALHEISNQVYLDLLDEVYRTGKPFVGSEMLAKLENRSGTLQDHYFNFVYLPWNDADGQTQGIFVHAVDITEQVVARKRLEEAAATRARIERASLLLGAIVDSSDDAIVSKDLNGIITSWNKGAEALFGYTAEEVIGKSITIIIPQDRLDEEPQILGKLRRGERVDHFETVRRRKDGALLDISLTISPVKNAQGKVIGASKIARDISERKRAQEAIQDLNMQLKADLAAMTRIQELSTRLVQAGDFDTLLAEIIDAGMEITGADMGNIQLFENNVLKVVAQRGFERPFLDFFNAVEHGYAACGTALERRARVIVDDVANSPLYDEPAREAMLAAGSKAVQSTPLVSRSGEVLGIFSTHYRATHRPAERELRVVDLLARQAADLIERKRAEAALIASEARFRQLADSMPQIVWTARADGIPDYYNERWYEFTGFERGPSSNESWESIVHPDDVRRSRDAWRQSVASGQPYDIEYRFWDRFEKRWRWFMGRALPVQDESGGIVKWFGSCTDIDEQKRVQEELRRANQDLEQFAYSASHDLQEPLRGVKIYSELLTKRYGARLDAQGLEFLEYLRGGATRMEMLVRDLLAYTQVTRLDAPEETTDANQALADTLADLKGAIAESGADVFHDRLPAVRVHSTHLKQLFLNLVGNAIKYRSPERRPEVRIGAEQRDGHWNFTVDDNGIGIEPEYKERIFGLFKRLHTGEEYSGTGIGLAICQRIVERYHGRIWVESQPGRGSRFTFTLPV